MASTLNEISVRPPGEDAGGPVVAVHYGPGSEPLEGRAAALLLIHGFNNHAGPARDSFRSFLTDLESATGRGALPWPVFGVQWPGDEKNEILSVVLYSTKVNVSQEAADQIFAFLQQTFGPGGSPITLRIVAHSLGCRLAVELLQRLVDEDAPSNVLVERVVLMAAAIPEGHVESDGNLRPGIGASGGVCVLHSTGDDVLQYAFRAGQTMAGDGFFPTAVGTYGNPSAPWRESYLMSEDGKSYGHSTYWTGSASALTAARFLGIPAAMETRSVAIGDRNLPQATGIPARPLNSRALPALL